MKNSRSYGDMQPHVDFYLQLLQYVNNPFHLNDPCNLAHHHKPTFEEYMFHPIDTRISLRTIPNDNTKKTAVKIKAKVINSLGKIISDKSDLKFLCSIACSVRTFVVIFIGTITTIIIAITKPIFEYAYTILASVFIYYIKKLQKCIPLIKSLTGLISFLLDNET